MMSEKNKEFYNFKTEKKLKRLRENLKRFDDKNIHMLTSLILASENYEETFDQSEATNTLILNSCKEFTFTNSVDGDKETIFKEGIAKLCQEYTDTQITFTDSRGKIRYVNQDDTHYLVFVKPVKYDNYTPYRENKMVVV